jgi:hypothetical protein
MRAGALPALIVYYYWALRGASGLVAILKFLYAC